MYLLPSYWRAAGTPSIYHLTMRGARDFYSQTRRAAREPHGSPFSHPAAVLYMVNSALQIVPDSQCVLLVEQLTVSKTLNYHIQ